MYLMASSAASPAHATTPTTPNQWLRGPLGEQFKDEVLRKSSHVETMLNAASIRRAFGEHQRGESDQSSLLWAVWVLERWAASNSDAPATLNPLPRSAMSAQ